MPLADNILPEASRPPTREEIERGRAMYAQGFAVARCLAASNMSLGTFYFWLDGGPRDASGNTLLPPIPRRRVVLGKSRRPLAADAVSLRQRLLRAARDLSAGGAGGARAPAGRDQPMEPPNVEELRRSLARKLEEIVAEADAEAAAQAQAGSGHSIPSS